MFILEDIQKLEKEPYAQKVLLDLLHNFINTQIIISSYKLPKKLKFCENYLIEEIYKGLVGYIDVK